MALSNASDVGPSWAKARVPAASGPRVSLSTLVLSAGQLQPASSVSMPTHVQSARRCWECEALTLSIRQPARTRAKVLSKVAVAGPS